MDNEWSSGILPEIVSRKYIQDAWGFWTVPGDKEIVHRSVEKIAWAYSVTSKDRRLLFLIDIIFYVCCQGDKLRESETEKTKLKYELPARSYDFSPEIGDYVRYILNDPRLMQNRNRLMSDSSKTESFKEEVKYLLKKCAEFLTWNHHNGLMLFLAHICKLYSILAASGKVDHLKVVIESAEALMSFYSDKFKGYEELHAFASQKLLDLLITDEIIDSSLLQAIQ